jgi:ABC-2 type transport system ATP-binding protein
VDLLAAAIDHADHDHAHGEDAEGAQDDPQPIVAHGDTPNPRKSDVSKRYDRDPGKFHPKPPKRNGAAVIVADSLVKIYGEFAAVQGLSFQVHPGEVVGLVGPNGAGKTTTLRALSGILRPTAGSVRIGGHDLVREPIAAKSLLAFVPDEPHLFEYLTVAEHLAFVGRLYRVADAPARIPRLLAELELADRAEKLPGELSRGMRQKLAIACGLLHDPRAILLDEPLTGLDPVGIRRMKATVRRRAEAGAAVLLSSHLLHLVEELCNRVLVLRRGRAVAFGTIEEIVGAHPELAGRSLEDVFVALVGGDDSPDPV